MKIFEQSQIEEIAAELDAGAVVAVPTETVYGLAVGFDNTAAIAKLMQLKDRAPDSGKVFPMMLADQGQISDFAIENDLSIDLAQRYFPGELTLVLPKNPDFHNPYFDNFDHIGIRIPNHDFMLGLLRAAGPLLVTSANARGETPAISSDEVIEQLPDIDAIVVGRAGGGLPSTIVEVVGGKLNILRQGGLEV